ncbi:cyclic lactone autoinducer peptide [Evansella vedderi]|uniref:Cyclic lactone autoinducer peptide n=1 Tax=Evansella vedderi TaxID=38282 RepID=A0ABT9ZP27_9BACI|nr:cyclic lactone autoinducer peptide [Evansella vedderi]MDQ0252992.1 cyclic lactone autoinducer peptide [Evansella vedderi]
MKRLLKVFVSAIVTFIILVAKADISSASTLTYYQPKLPDNKNN